MVIYFYCPTGHLLSVNAAMAGKRVRCGLCGHTAIVPAALPNPPSRPISHSTYRPNMPATRPSSPPPTKKPIPKVAQPPGKPQPTTHQPPAPPPTQPSPALPGSAPVAPSPEPRRPPGIELEVAEPIQPAPPRLSPTYVPSEVFQPGRLEARRVMFLAGGIALAVVASLLPIVLMRHVRLWEAPGWAQLTAFLAVVQAAYLVWMLAVPDWSTVRVMMIVCTIVAAVYAAVMSLALFTQVDHPLMLGLGEVRRSAAGWCSLMLITMAVLSMVCGRIGSRWPRSAAPSAVPSAAGQTPDAVLSSGPA